jgi:UDP-N-acetyl-D-mannosaminuronate dehydrogenase
MPSLATYKRDVDDIREVPALELLALLHARGAVLAYSDAQPGPNVIRIGAPRPPAAEALRVAVA